MWFTLGMSLFAFYVGDEAVYRFTLGTGLHAVHIGDGAVLQFTSETKMFGNILGTILSVVHTEVGAVGGSLWG